MDKKQIAINTHLMLCFLLFCALLLISVDCAVENEIGLCVAFSLFLLLPIFVLVVSPLYFVFSDDCVEIVYILGAKEIIRWKDIKSITLMGSWITKHASPPHYAIAYRCKEKRPFFVRGEIPKTRRTKKLIKKYYKKQIVG
ncbi:MAG: hypothetical protein IJZ15_03300 [Oscillospiraceae bacterium]|nr:hypothetical protein [Oscillospiraceae bacterium]